MTKYYKVVRRISAACIGQDADSTVLVSATYSCNEWSVVYTPRRWAVPNIDGSRLFVFNNMDMAVRFAGRTILPGSPELEVWRINARGLSTPPSMLSVTSRSWGEMWDGGVYMESYAASGYAASGIISVADTPPGTMLAERVRLVELVAKHIRKVGGYE